MTLIEIGQLMLWYFPMWWYSETLELCCEKKKRYSYIPILSSCSIYSYYCLYFYLFSYLFLNLDFREGNSSEDAEDLDLNSPERESEYSRRFSLGKLTPFLLTVKKTLVTKRY